ERGPGLRKPGLAAVLADDRDRRHVALREAAEVVRQTEQGFLLALALAGTAVHLQVHFIDHAQARGANRMAKALEPAIDLARYLSARIVKAVEHILDSPAFWRDVEVLHGDELGHREAVVHLDQAQLLARPIDAGLGIGAFG